MGAAEISQDTVGVIYTSLFFVILCLMVKRTFEPGSFFHRFPVVTAVFLLLSFVAYLRTPTFVNYPVLSAVILVVCTVLAGKALARPQPAQ